jgi:glycosyltransferase involved in cell wall biosynthesis
MPTNTNEPCRADLHVHSKFSDRPSEWFLRRIGAPESFVEPLHIYETARARGLSFVTISDHNCIDGALEIAHLPNTFISTEVTTYFPEDGCKVHVLVSGISEDQFKMIQELRENIYEFRRYVAEQDIVTTCAHPLYRVNDRLSVEQFEKLILLFNRFEAINGTRDPRACELAHLILRSLTPRMIERMADAHDIEPLGSQPWVKSFTGGSDDHSGLYVGHARTVTPYAASVAEFLQHLRDGQHQPEGSHGTSIQLAHCFYQIGYSYYKDRLMSRSPAGTNLVGELFKRLLDEPRKSSTSTGITGKLYGVAERFFRARKLRQMSEVERTLVEEFTTIFRAEMQARQTHAANPAGTPILSDQRTFSLASRISHLLTYSFLRKFHKYAQEGRLVDSLQTIASLGPVFLAIAPYLASFKTQHKDEVFLQSIASRFDVTKAYTQRSGRKAWITDTLSDINGVAATIRTLGASAQQAGKPLTIVSCVDNPPRIQADLKNFQPVGTFQLPEYEGQTLAFPPFLEVMTYLEREKFSEVIISTPGPMGIVALAAAKLLGMNTVGIYHTDFPAYVRTLTQDGAMEQITWRFMSWFYQQMDTILVPSESYRQQLIRAGFEPRKLLIMERGVDTERFNPSHRRPEFWADRGLEGAPVVSYVGRISREKNIESLLAAHALLAKAGKRINLAIVGDGPYLQELRRSHQRPDVLFTGFLEGKQLSQAFASSDLFVFPSMTDTFGNVVLEAQASGLPVIVSDKGGPADIVRSNDSGVIIDMTQPETLANAIDQLLSDEAHRRTLAARSMENATQSSWNSVLEHFWTARAEPTTTPTKKRSTNRYDDDLELLPRVTESISA